jgi:hypothetical protein
MISELTVGLCVCVRMCARACMRACIRAHVRPLYVCVIYKLIHFNSHVQFSGSVIHP